LKEKWINSPCISFTKGLNSPLTWHSFCQPSIQIKQDFSTHNKMKWDSCHGVQPSSLAYIWWLLNIPRTPILVIPSSSHNHNSPSGLNCQTETSLLAQHLPDVSVFVQFQVPVTPDWLVTLPLTLCENIYESHISDKFISYQDFLWVMMKLIPMTSLKNEVLATWNMWNWIIMRIICLGISNSFSTSNFLVYLPYDYAYTQ
jgi:hypothetical protein